MKKAGKHTKSIITFGVREFNKKILKNKVQKEG